MSKLRNQTMKAALAGSSTRFGGELKSNYPPLKKPVILFGCKPVAGSSGELLSNRRKKIISIYIKGDLGLCGKFLHEDPAQLPATTRQFLQAVVFIGKSDFATPRQTTRQLPASCGEANEVK
jgi:hypothetical protein